MKKIIFASILLALPLLSCNDNESMTLVAPSKDITKAEKASIDRFSAASGHLFVRTAANGLPAANAAINMDAQPFITQGLNPDGTMARYYNFDIQSDMPAPIYVLYKNDGTPVPGQNNIVDVIPGDTGYSDFWLVNKVTVPSDYVSNSISSKTELTKAGYAATPTNIIVNCPIVPAGSTAARSKAAGIASALTLGWYKGKQVSYFNFNEAALATNPAGKVPALPIRVMFNDNAAGPSSGFKTEPGTLQTHNVISAAPAQTGYSPLWDVYVVDNANFNAINNWATSSSFTAIAHPGALVNCPVVK